MDAAAAQLDNEQQFGWRQWRKLRVVIDECSDFVQLICELRSVLYWGRVVDDSR